MFNSPILETVIGLVFILFIFSVLVTCVQEVYVTINKSRGKMLQNAIGEVLNDRFNKNFAYLLYQHPQIDLLKQKQDSLPSYIDSEIFANALIDLVAKESMETIYVESSDKKELNKMERIKPALLRKSDKEIPELIADPNSIDLETRFKMGVESLEYSDLKKLLLSFHSTSTAGKDSDILEGLKKQIIDWYSGYMDRVTGWYKRLVRKNIIVAGAIVTLFFNLNFITVTKTVYADSKLRGALVKMADSSTKSENPISDLTEKLKKDPALTNVDVNALVGTELPIGWKSSFKDAGVEGKKFGGKVFRYIGYFFENHFTFFNIIGWALFVMCLSFGAPFWFDIMKKLINIRNAGINSNEKK